MSSAVLDAGFVLAIMAAGMTVLARDTLQARCGAAELAPRLVMGFIGAHFSQPICRQAIEAANASPRRSPASRSRPPRPSPACCK
jgi:hypothetical protein